MNDRIRAETCHEVHAGYAVRGDFDLVTFASKLIAINGRNNLVVLDDEDFLHGQLLEASSR